MAGAEFVVLAVPSQRLRENLVDWVPYLPEDSVVISLMKGVELGTLKRMSEVIHEVTGVGPERIAVVSGPNLAKEIARREPAAAVVACEDEEVAKRLRDLCHSPAFRPYSSIDVDRLRARRRLQEHHRPERRHGRRPGLRRQHDRLGDHPWPRRDRAPRPPLLGADPMTLMGLAGLGDLVATCSSPLSRNRSFGEKLGQGMTTEEILASSRQVAEGVKSCSSLLDLAKQTGVYAPIVEHVHAVVEGEMTAGDMLKSLVNRDTKHERD